MQKEPRERQKESSLTIRRNYGNMRYGANKQGKIFRGAQ